MAKSALVVDDDPGVLALTNHWLKEAGYEVTTLSDFWQAKGLVRSTRFDLLLTDVRLGEFNGLQLAIEARNADPDIRIVVMSGWDDVDLAREVAACTAVRVLKPFVEHGLLDAIRLAEV